METVEELINEMLTINPETQLASWEDTINTRRIVTQFMVNMGKRLQSAYKREVGISKTETTTVESTCKEPLSVESVTTCNPLQESCRQTLQGNAAKMREACEKADAILTRIGKSAWFIDANFGETVELVEAGNAIRQALSAPPLPDRMGEVCGILDELFAADADGDDREFNAVLTRLKDWYEKEGGAK